MSEKKAPNQSIDKNTCGVSSISCTSGVSPGLAYPIDAYHAAPAFPNLPIGREEASREQNRRYYPNNENRDVIAALVDRLGRG